ncbi:MAG TPA: hypothetical protein VH186_13735 [Chloroflexia bacterium]|nr:hypothetical protein [Chloroflexia bacterium]
MNDFKDYFSYKQEKFFREAERERLFTTIRENEKLAAGNLNQGSTGQPLHQIFGKLGEWRIVRHTHSHVLK